MKTKLCALLLMLLVAIPGFSQTATTQTILTAALSGGAANNQVTVASATGMSASTNLAQRFVWVDGEIMQIQSISGSVLTVLRGRNATSATPHGTGSIVYYGAGGGVFNVNDGSASGVFLGTAPRGGCTPTEVEFLPVIVPGGDVYTCVRATTAAEQSVAAGPGSTPGRAIWQRILLHPLTGPSFPYRSVANAAYTATLADYYVEYNSATAGRTLTLPNVSQIFGKVMIVKNGAATQAITVQGSGTGQHIGTIGTLSVTLEPGGIARLISNGAGWSTW